MAMVDVHMTDGRTVFRAMSRGTMVKLFRKDLEEFDEGRAESVWVMWHPQAEWELLRVHYMKKHSVAWVREVPPKERDEFLLSRPAGEPGTKRIEDVAAIAGSTR